MAIIEIKNLPAGTPTQSKKLPMDLVKAESATIKDIVFAGRPAASQAEAEAGVDAEKVMTAIATKQSIASEVGVSIASSAEAMTAPEKAKLAALPDNATLQATYLRLTSLPEKNLLQRGIVANNPSAAAANAAIVNQAISEITNNYGTIYQPLGDYYIDGYINIPNTSATLKGDGRGVSRWLMSGTNPGVQFSLSSLNYSCHVKDISILTTTTSTRAGLRIERPVSSNADGLFGPTITNVEVGGTTLTTGFTHDFFLNYCWGAEVLGCLGRGRPGVSAGIGDLLGAMLVLAGNSTGVVFQRNKALFRNQMVVTAAASFSEGLQCQFNEAVACNRGVVLTSSVGAPEGASPPYGVISNNHFATNQSGVELYFRPQYNINRNSFYNRLQQSGDATNGANWIGVYLNNANQIDVSHNNTIGYGGGTFMLSDSTVFGTVVDNYIDGVSVGVNGNNNSNLWVKPNGHRNVTTQTTGMTGSTVETQHTW